MSWLFCVLSHKPFLKWEIDKFIQTHKSTDNTIINPSFYLAFGGCKSAITIHYNDYQHNSGWIVLGNGYLSKETGFGLAEKNDWKRLIEGEIDWQDMNGQFIIFKWDEYYIEVWNDTLGMKDVYFSRSQGYVLISTRLDWVSPYLEKKPWNYSAFGAILLMPHMLVSQSLLKNVLRLGAAGYVKASIHKFQTGNRRIDLIDFEETDLNHYFFRLNKSMTLYPDYDKHLLTEYDKSFAKFYALSLLMNKAKKNWSVLEPFGKEELEQFTLFQNTFNISSEQNPGIDDSKRLFNLWKEYLLSTFQTGLPFELNYVQFAPQLNKADYTFMQTDYSQFFFSKDDFKANRAFQKAFYENNPDALLKIFPSDSSWIRNEFLIFLKKGLSQHLDELHKHLSQFVFKTDTQKNQYIVFYTQGVQNYAQKLGFMSQYARFYNPFMFFELFKNRINLNITNSQLFKTYHTQIEANCPELAFYLKSCEKMPVFPNKMNQNLLIYKLFKEEILETLHSSGIRKTPYYNLKKLDKILSKAESDDEKYINTIIKCFMFEIIRSHLE